MKSRLLTTESVIAPIIGAFVLLVVNCAQSQVVGAAAKESGPLKPVVSNTAPVSVELPPLSPEIIAMVQTNSGAIVEERIHIISNAKITPTEKAQAMFLMFEGLDKQGQRKVAHAAVKYTDDKIYFLVRDHLMDTNLHPQVLSVFMTDTLKRSNALKVPVLLSLARLDGHPMQAEARQLLRLYSGKDYGTDWARWEQAMFAWMDKNPN